MSFATSSPSAALDFAGASKKVDEIAAAAPAAAGASAVCVCASTGGGEDIGGRGAATRAAIERRRK
jgi:hypothetical protein